MPQEMYVVIMAGGRGERFWPLSTRKRPKQVLALVGGKPLIESAVERLEGFVPPERIFVITSADLVATVAATAPNLPPENVIGEPVGRDTAAVCALGSALVKARDPQGVFGVLTADHVIGDPIRFRAVLNQAATFASANDALLTIGIEPTSASTGFGYIEADEPIAHDGDVEFRRAKRFVEKPDAATAERYVDSGRFFWNSGMFVWSVATLERALAQHAPQLLAMAQRLLPYVGAAGFPTTLATEYEKIAKISIDYALMEKADNIVMAKGAFGWDDVGSWPALDAHFDHDAAGNVLIGACRALDAAGNVVVSDHRLTALIGVEDLVIVQAENATLVCRKDAAQDVKKMVKLLADTGREDLV